MTKNPLLKKILRNLDKICLDPLGDLANSETLKNRSYRDGGTYYYRLSKDCNPNHWETEPDWEKIWNVEIEGEKINLPEMVRGEDYQKTRTALIQEIIQNKNDWTIKEEGGATVVINTSGRKHWKEGITWGGKEWKKDWDQIEAATLKKSPTPLPQQENPPKQKENKWYKPTDYPKTWTVVILLTALVSVFFIFWLASKKKKKNTNHFS